MISQTPNHPATANWPGCHAGRVALAVGTSSLAGYLAALAGTLVLVILREY
jgi:hypothetical protein